MLIAGRMFQAIGGCAGIVLGRAMIRDMHGRDKAASMIGYVTMAMAVVPMVAPAVGGYLDVWFGWRATFVAMLAFWILTAFALDWFLRGIMAVASGAIVPLWFMPPPLAAALGYLPFAWVSYYPSAVYLGKLDLPEAGLHLVIGLVWLAVLGAFLAWLWSRARHRLIVQGG